MTETDRFRLSPTFPPVDAETWRARAEADLKGKPLDRLATHTADGLAIEPLYTAPDGRETAPWRRGFAASGTAHPRPRVVLARHALDAASPATLNDAVLESLEGGATGILFDRDDALAAPLDAAALATILDGVALSDAPLWFAPSRSGAALARAALSLAAERGVSLGGCLGLDPLGALARGGALTTSVDAAFDDAFAVAAEAAALGAPELRCFAVDGLAAHAAGAAEGLDLGALGSGAIAWLRAGERAGVGPDAIARSLALRVGVGTDFFTGIAKLRALREIIGRIFSASGASAGAIARIEVVAEVSPRVLTERDPWVNVLRTTTAAFAALVGGADALVPVAHDAIAGTNTRLGARVARNSALILQLESHLHRVVDPAGGAWFLESLTTQLAEQGWTALQTIESQGGLATALGSGWLQARIGETNAARATAIAKRKQPITGVSEFPDLAEKRPERPAPRRAVEAAEVAGTDGVAVDPLVPVRFAAPWEALRDRADRWSDARTQTTNPVPRVFVATLGPLAEHNARVGWMTNFVGAGGLHVALGPVEGDREAIVEAWRRAATPVALVCGTDARYAEEGAALVAALRAAGASQVWIAGRASDGLREAGATGFAYLGCDVLAALERMWSALDAEEGAP